MPKPTKRRRRVERPKSGVGLLPTLLTLFNGLCGLGAIALASGAMPGVPESGYIAALLIYLGMVFDMLDGQAARWLKQTSSFGAELDSLCDAITFGVAPVFVLLEFSDIFAPRFVFGAGAVYVACVLLRLARFNVHTDEGDSHDNFSGLPSPAAAGTIASFAIAMPGITQLSTAGIPAATQTANILTGIIMAGLPILALLLAWLMVSTIQYPHIVNQWLRQRYHYGQIVVAILAILVALTFHEIALPLGFCCFALHAPLRVLLRRIKLGRQPDSPSTTPPAPPAEEVLLIPHDH